LLVPLLLFFVDDDDDVEMMDWKWISPRLISFDTRASVSYAIQRDLIAPATSMKMQLTMSQDNDVTKKYLRTSTI
jgi:hypothetical protein